MSDDFGTVNVTRGQRAREIEVMRQHYRKHRESLMNMVADAPTEHLATEYQRLVRDIDSSLVKLDELEGRPTERHKTEPGMRPLVTPPVVAPPAVSPMAAPISHGHSAQPLLDDDTQIDYLPGAEPVERQPRAGGGARSMMIVAGGIVVLALIAWLLWRASSDRTPAITATQPVTDTEAVATEDREPSATTGTVIPVPQDGLTVTPTSHDYGVIRKGTRAVRQFELTNRGDDSVTIQVARSACRCLYYEYGNGVIPAKGKATITVTIDGARAKAGELHESIAVTPKGNTEPAAHLDIRATIR
ncbi:MAG TPA: DUF1573 domain-containing protein [Thermoanaerobaculia bacterium]|nr:DUF1573 domain-containing protein [Thermoanaerobaculia bacterium]